MIFKKCFYNNKIRQGIRISLAIAFALFITTVFALKEPFWVWAATIFVMLTAIGSAFYQGLLRFFVLTGIAIVISFVFSSTKWLDIRVTNITIGAAIGIIINMLILPDRIDIEFRKAVVPLLRAYVAYFSGIVTLLVNHEASAADKARNEVEMILPRLPAWVYEAGFDITMQKGYRYFFMKLGHVSEILFSMQQIARYPFNEVLLVDISQPLEVISQKLKNWVDALVTLLELKKLSEGVDDIQEEIIKIEEDFKKTVPLSLELLEVKKEYVYFAEFIYNLKDLRNALTMLAKALR